jgi:CRP-like cAMP-binding protein
MIDYFINATDFVEYKAGQVVFEQGSSSDHMYAIKEGEIEILHEGKSIEVLGPGQFFGEMSLVDNAPHSATAVARTDCKLVLVNRHRFLFMVQETPTFALEVMHVMSERIRKMTDLLY